MHLDISGLPHPPDYNSIDDALESLRRATDRLKRYSLQLAILSILSVAGSLALISYRSILSVQNVVFYMTLGILVICFVLALLLAVGFEATRKNGDVLFKEISDELQWHARYTEKSELSASLTPPTRPLLGARLALRSFAQSSDLPLVPGKYGPLMYALVNILSVAFAVFLITSLK